MEWDWSKVLDYRWRATENDMIGGHCVVPEEETRKPSEGATLIVADFVSEAVAEHIAKLHNAWLEEQTSL